MKNIKIALSPESIEAAIEELKDIKSRLKNAEVEIVERLAMYGATRVSLNYARSVPDGDIAPSIDVRINRNKRKAVIAASGEDVGFIEFGSGAKYGYGHPLNSQFGTGPGTYPDGKGNWDKPNGWWFKSADGSKHHTYGNPPSMGMYRASLDIQAECERIVREVISEAIR